MLILAAARMPVTLGFEAHALVLIRMARIRQPRNPAVRAVERCHESAVLLGAQVDAFWKRHDQPRNRAGVEQCGRARRWQCVACVLSRRFSWGAAKAHRLAIRRKNNAASNAVTLALAAGGSKKGATMVPANSGGIERVLV